MTLRKAARKKPLEFHIHVWQEESEWTIAHILREFQSTLSITWRSTWHSTMLSTPLQHSCRESMLNNLNSKCTLNTNLCTDFTWYVLIKMGINSPVDLHLKWIKKITFIYSLKPFIIMIDIHVHTFKKKVLKFDAIDSES